MFQPPLILQSSLTVVMLCFSTQLARLPSRSSDRERGEPWYFSLFHTSPVSGGGGGGSSSSSSSLRGKACRNSFSLMIFFGCVTFFKS